MWFSAREVLETAAARCHAAENLSFSLNVFTEFAEFSEKKWSKKIFEQASSCYSCRSNHSVSGHMENETVL